MPASVISIAAVRPVHSISLSINSAPRARALFQVGEYLRECGYRFTTPTPLTHARVNARPGKAHAHDLAGVFGWSRKFAPDVTGPVLLGLMYDAGVVDCADGMLRSAVRASNCGQDLFLHSAFPTSGADAVFFGPDTYRFLRALDASMRERRTGVLRAADIGCGSGAAAIAVARAFPGATVHAVDINDSALMLTGVNARLARANLVPVRSDLLSNVEGQFDLIVSNPPYLLDRERRVYRHGGGDFGEGLSLKIVAAAIERLRLGGTLMLYTGSAIVAGIDPFKLAAERLLRAAGLRWTYEELDPDVFGEELDMPAYQRAERIAAVWLCATRG